MLLVGTKQLYTQNWFTKENVLCDAGHASTMLHLIILDFWFILVKGFGPWVVWDKTVNKERSFIAFVNMYMYHNYFCGFRNYLNKKVNRKVQGVPKLQTAANYQEAEKRTNTNTCKAIKQMHEKHKDQLPLPQARWSQWRTESTRKL